jgi:hypothetical protein
MPIDPGECRRHARDCVRMAQGVECLFDEWGQAQVERQEAAFDLGQGGECDEKDKRDWSHSSGSSSAVRSAYIASAIPRQRFVIVRRQGASRYRATANTRERCWRPPQTS